MDAPRRVILGVSLGLLATAAVAVGAVALLQARVMEEALGSQGERLERHLATLVDRAAARELAPGGGGLEAFAVRMARAAEGNPRILDLTVVDERRRVVARHPAQSEAAPCFDRLPLGTPAEHQHPAGGVDEEQAVGCLALPVRQGERLLGAVFVHARRPWVLDGQRAARLVGRSAGTVAPVFLVTLLVLAALLVLASRAARRWRLAAAAARRVEALGAMASGINHELQNPLNAISLSLQYLARRHDDPETREVVDAARRQTTEVSGRLAEFARFAGLVDLEVGPVALGELVDRAAADHGRAVRRRGDAVVRGDREQLRGAFEALFGLLAQDPGAEPGVSVAIRPTSDEIRVIIEVGTPGLDADLVERLFDPWIRARQGDVGRGLAFARAVFRAHGGDLRADLRGERLALEGRLSNRERET